MPTIFADVHEIEEFDKRLVHKCTKFRTVRFQSTLSSMIYMQVESRSIMRNRNIVMIVKQLTVLTVPHFQKPNLAVNQHILAFSGSLFNLRDCNLHRLVVVIDV